MLQTDSCTFPQRIRVSNLIKDQSILPKVTSLQKQSFLLALCPEDISQGGISATQGQKLHTDDINQCLRNKSGSHWVPNASLFNFRFLQVNFGKVLCSSANELQQNSNAPSREDISHKY